MEATVQRNGKKVMVTLATSCLTGLVVLIVLIAKGIRRIKHNAGN